MLQTLLDQFLQNSGLELLAVVLAVAYLLLAVKENHYCWHAAFFSTLIFLYLFWQVRLYMESALQIFYLAMAVYGWQQWRQVTDNKPRLAIQRWSWQRHGLVACCVLVLSGISGLLLSHYTDAQLPYLDAFTTWASIVTTYMVTQKVLENWAYWLLIDSVSIYLYLDRALYFTALLFLIYILIIAYGWSTWQQRYSQQSVADCARL
ncbi:nicotinamide riboside transporter PnuC [Pseudomonadales bacterium]|nr:nicotinamide riboside transporter PnuC [Pseudomonadales bacterium]MDB4150358.1 nicotinamide riboside transporter PnuC [Pseudomonadales bacterium]MDC1368454.1 nicotinamide riboside transporter PnuC [Pseudomonadales bacterium]